MCKIVNPRTVTSMKLFQQLGFWTTMCDEWAYHLRLGALQFLTQRCKSNFHQAKDKGKQSTNSVVGMKHRQRDTNPDKCETLPTIRVANTRVRWMSIPFRVWILGILNTKMQVKFLYTKDKANDPRNIRWVEQGTTKDLKWLVLLTPTRSSLPFHFRAFPVPMLNYFSYVANYILFSWMQ